MLGVQNIISKSLMKKIDKYTVEKLNIPELILVENAGYGAYNILKDSNSKIYTIICGTGNNGADGLCLARHLFINGKFVYLNILGNIENASNSFKKNLEMAKSIGLSFRQVKDNLASIEILKGQMQRSDVVVDCIFGIGLNRDIEGLPKNIIDQINNSGKYVISLDIPSGLEADNGEVLGVAVKANKTITFYKAKNALVNSKEYAGDVQVVSIGIPYEIDLEY